MQEPGPADKRKMLIYPTPSLTISEGQNNSELGEWPNRKEYLNF